MFVPFSNFKEFITGQLLSKINVIAPQVTSISQEQPITKQIKQPQDTTVIELGDYPVLKEVVKKGVIVCAAPQTIFGKLDPYVYSTGRELMETGIIYLGDMLSETALVKLGWVLGHSEWTKNKEKMKNNEKLKMKN